MRCESAIVVSSGLPMVLPSQPLPDNRLASSGTPCGWMNKGTPSCSAFAHTGWNFGSENSTPFTTPPIAAPFNPCFFTAVSSSCTARSGACKVSEAKAANRSGFEAQSSASFSFWIFTIAAARSRSRLYQEGLIDSTSRSMACASMAASRLSISMNASAAPLTGGSWTAASAPSSAPASRKWQWACTSMVLTRLPPTMTGSFWRTGCSACALCKTPQLQKTMPVVTAAVPALRKSRLVRVTIPPIAVVGWRGLPPPRRPGLDPPAVRGRTARLEASVRHAMGRQQDGLFAPRHVAPDQRRPYRKTKTFLGGSNARQPVARQVNSLRHRGSGHRAISHNARGRAKEGRHSAALSQRQSAQHLIARGIDHRFGDAVFGRVQQPRGFRSRQGAREHRYRDPGSGGKLVLGRDQYQADLQAAAGREMARRQALYGKGCAMHLADADRQGRGFRISPQPAQGLARQAAGRHDQWRLRGHLRAERAAAQPAGAAGERFFRRLSVPCSASDHAHPA